MIWDFQDTLSRRLLLWSALSAGAGAVLLLAGADFWRGFGIQALAWGAIDAAIALFGQRAAARRRATGPHAAAALAGEAVKLRRLLWINTGLDLLYVTGGLVLLYTMGTQNRFAGGNGWGVIVQGGFLFVFDLLHAIAVPRREPALPALEIFSGPEHAAFRLSGSRSANGGAPAALLVHGFGGTPAEMRGLAEALRAAGWTVEAILLPGFGADFATLTERRHEEWLAAVEAAAARLAGEGHRPLLLVGYSMGAALTLLAAGALRPAGVIALAPFWWAEQWWTRPVEFFVRPFLPIGFRPLRKADFGNPQLRQGLGKFMPGLDLDDLAAQAALRDFRVPLGLTDQLRGLSRRMLAALPQVDAPVLLVQGTRDSVVRVEQTRRLRRRLSNDVRYVEVDSEHDLTLAENPAWPQVEAAVLEFVQDLVLTEAAPVTLTEPTTEIA